eukprot:CAMPEP_0181307016 /NCGR_PEP_ID=MMETSP1101-20121128/10629_1 /TAXON_ID=46948 /ORGANISM="Rhodomonas abbreviata, Strain Caron Lab Isolate" /LENGTH=161 /DNA_ID=CAMNT_0023413153 /DNA_START=349 /DNA_END=834 /DNA_ORIENTATION=-
MSAIAAKSETYKMGSKILHRLNEKRSQGTIGMIPRAEHATAWNDDTTIDAFGIGVDLGEQRRAGRSGVKGVLPSAEPKTQWKSCDSVDAFSVFMEDASDAMEYDPNTEPTLGRLPRADHGTVWESTNRLDAFSVFTEDDRTEDDDEGPEVEHVMGVLPKID